MSDSHANEPAWISLMCRNHPDFRWTMKNPRTAHLRISRNPMLMFKGHKDGGDGLTANDVGSRLFENEEFRTDMMQKGYVFECDCPLDDLVEVTE